MIAKAPESNGFLIDGYPRELEQGKRFEAEVRTSSSIAKIKNTKISNYDITLGVETYSISYAERSQFNYYHLSEEQDTGHAVLEDQ